MPMKLDKRLEKLRADLRASRSATRTYRAAVAAAEGRAGAARAGLAILADPEQSWARGEAAEVVDNVRRIAALSLEGLK
jgi:hypothetical protein